MPWWKARLLGLYKRLNRPSPYGISREWGWSKSVFRTWDGRPVCCMKRVENVMIKKIVQVQSRNSNLGGYLCDYSVKANAHMRWVFFPSDKLIKSYHTVTYLGASSAKSSASVCETVLTRTLLSCTHLEASEQISSADVSEMRLKSKTEYEK